jgi:hypothetical protein
VAEVAGAVESSVVEVVGVARVVIGTRVAEARMVVEGGVVVVAGAEGSNLNGVEQARDERRRT